MQFKKRTAQALSIMKLLSDNQGASISVYAMSEILKQSFSATTKVCQDLQRHGLVMAERGCAGGFLITRQDISVLDVVDVVDHLGFNFKHDAVAGLFEEEVKEALDVVRTKMQDTSVGADWLRSLIPS